MANYGNTIIIHSNKYYKKNFLFFLKIWGRGLCLYWLDVLMIYGSLAPELPLLKKFLLTTCRIELKHCALKHISKQSEMSASINIFLIQSNIFCIKKKINTQCCI